MLNIQQFVMHDGTNIIAEVIEDKDDNFILVKNVSMPMCYSYEVFGDQLPDLEEKTFAYDMPDSKQVTVMIPYVLFDTPTQIQKIYRSLIMVNTIPSEKLKTIYLCYLTYRATKEIEEFLDDRKSKTLKIKDNEDNEDNIIKFQPNPTKH